MESLGVPAVQYLLKVGKQKVVVIPEDVFKTLSVEFASLFSVFEKEISISVGETQPESLAEESIDAGVSSSHNDHNINALGAVAQGKASIIIPDLYILSDEVAQAFGNHMGRLELPALQRFYASAAEILANHPGELVLPEPNVVTCIDREEPADRFEIFQVRPPVVLSPEDRALANKLRDNAQEKQSSFSAPGFSVGQLRLGMNEEEVKQLFEEDSLFKFDPRNPPFDSDIPAYLWGPVDKKYSEEFLASNGLIITVDKKTGRAQIESKSEGEAARPSDALDGRSSKVVETPMYGALRWQVNNPDDYAYWEPNNSLLFSQGGTKEMEGVVLTVITLHEVYGVLDVEFVYGSEISSDQICAAMEKKGFGKAMPKGALVTWRDDVRLDKPPQGTFGESPVWFPENNVKHESDEESDEESNSGEVDDAGVEEAPEPADIDVNKRCSIVGPVPTTKTLVVSWNEVLDSLVEDRQKLSQKGTPKSGGSNLGL